ncbi:GIY-YIG nuclease family protein [Clostridium perfringens]|uniref:GIY-YIG nuclease family protein n=1 Tax=Clostridium perfringens TaxID=1502 RepID=UPI0039E8030B
MTNKKIQKILTKKCATCKKEFTTTYYRVYCKECYSARMKGYRQKDKGYYLYIILDKFNKVLYVGSTTHIYTRLHGHITNNTNIKDLMLKNTWDKIKYLDVSNLVKNENELRYLENELIEVYETERNKDKPKFKNINKLRALSLGAELHSYDINKNFKTYITREEYQDQKKTKKKVI